MPDATRTTRIQPHPAAVLLALLLVTVCAVLPARGADRPFVLTASAAAEEDDGPAWAVESWWTRAGSQPSLSIAPSYGFNPTDSVQFEFSRSLDRSAGERADGLEIEFKHLFNRIGRDGWGWGVDIALALGNANRGAWRGQGLAVKLPWTLQLRDGGAALHVNAGLSKARGERREWVGSAAYEHELPGHITGFVEVGREDRQTLLHGGVRHWIKREKFVLDFGVQRLRGATGSSSGVLIGVNWYDL